MYLSSRRGRPSDLIALDICDRDGVEYYLEVNVFFAFSYRILLGELVFLNWMFIRFTVDKA
jgi:hypothetical protein